MKPRYLYRISFAVMTSCIFCNVVLAGYVFFRLRKPQVYNVIVPPSIGSITNDLAFGSVSNVSSSVRVVENFESSTNHISLAYHYAIVQGVRTAIIGGYPYTSGDIHAFGVIKSIYPERIFLKSGDIIDNIYINHNNKGDTHDS